jgi:hypothetical protein
MDYLGASSSKGIAPTIITFVLIALFIAAFALSMGYLWRMGCGDEVKEGYTYQDALSKKLKEKEGEGAQAGVAMAAGPSGVASGFTDMGSPAKKEGFFAGPARGTGAPDCLHASSDAAALYDMLLSYKGSVTEEGPDDLREMKLILSKISCFKQDLMGAGRTVEATRYQPFSTSHDMEAVAETTARCFAKTIPQRDLMLSLDKWGSRGTYLIKRLCTSLQMSDSAEEEALQLFGRAMADVGDIAMGACCNSDVAVIGGKNAPRMVGGYEAPGLNELREYKGYY